MIVLIVWGRAPRPSKPSTARELPAVTATLGSLQCSPTFRRENGALALPVLPSNLYQTKLLSSAQWGQSLPNCSVRGGTRP